MLAVNWKLRAKIFWQLDKEHMLRLGSFLNLKHAMGKGPSSLTLLVNYQRFLVLHYTKVHGSKGPSMECKKMCTKLAGFNVGNYANVHGACRKLTKYKAVYNAFQDLAWDDFAPVAMIEVFASAWDENDMLETLAELKANSKIKHTKPNILNRVRTYQKRRLFKDALSFKFKSLNDKFQNDNKKLYAKQLTQIAAGEMDTFLQVSKSRSPPFDGAIPDERADYIYLIMEPAAKKILSDWETAAQPVRPANKQILIRADFLAQYKYIITKGSFRGAILDPPWGILPGVRDLLLLVC